ncbi:MAG: maleylpyruvate isomerase family protein [Chitinophagaceae bacterium]|nr:maleylpyruvate isomerase family protein [Chitinophagaceae bacterium]
MPTAPPINVNGLFPILDNELTRLLSSLTEEEWHRPTIARLWNVKDVAAHLLDGNVRVLSMSRDKYFGMNPGDKPLLDFLNDINADWVKAMKRMSPAVLLWLLELTSRPVSDHFTSLDPYGKAIFPVAWAGEAESLNWMHIAREYTERFIHQQQIRHAVDKPGIVTKELFYPFIDTFMQALPYTYRDIQAEEGTVVKVSVTTEAGGDWYISRERDRWKLAGAANADAALTIDPDTAWQLFSKGITPAAAKKRVKIEGDVSLAEVGLTMVSVMA